MSKMSDQLKKALDKKRGIHHPEADDAPQVERKTAKQRAPVIGKKPPTRSAGRGRWTRINNTNGEQTDKAALSA